MRKILLAFLATTILLLTGCGQKTQTTTSSEKKKSDSIVETALSFSPKELFKSIGNCRPSDTCTYFKINYIEASSGKIKDKLNAFIGRQVLAGAEFGDTLPVSIQAAADSFLVSYNQAKKQFPDMPGFWSWDYSMKIYNETPKILCLSAESYSFMGGAHPNSFTNYFNISKETGDTISLTALLSPGFETKLNALIDKKYREMKGLKPHDNLMTKGDLFENKITFNYNVAVTKDGLLFYYNAYEIAPYAVGPIKISLNKAELGDLISQTSPMN